MELFDYQKKALDFFKEKKKIYIAFDMGMGKTITSLACAKEIDGNTLLIAENNEIENNKNFEKEVNNHFSDELGYINLKKETDIPTEKKVVGGINAESLHKVDQSFIDTVKVVIIDEATSIKNIKSKRSQKVLEVTEQCEYLIFLSGTPMQNGAVEIFSPLLLLQHDMVYEKDVQQAFETVFAGGHYRLRRKLPVGVDTSNAFYNPKYRYKYFMWWAKGANNLRELRYLTRDKFFVMTKDETDIFKKKVRTIETVPMSTEWYQEYMGAWQEYLKSAKKRDVDMDNVKEMKKLIENGQCYQVNSRWKASRIAGDIARGKYGTGKIVLFTLFVETYNEIRNMLAYYDVSQETFDGVENWKQDPSIQVIVGKIKAHGKGTNLPEASTTIFVDMDFVPANNLQAENRIDRPEQKNEMLITYYLTEGDNVDKHVREINRKKSRAIKEFMRPFTQEELDEMPYKIEKLKKKFPEECLLLGI